MSSTITESQTARYLQQKPNSIVRFTDLATPYPTVPLKSADGSADSNANTRAGTEIIGDAVLLDYLVKPENFGNPIVASTGGSVTFRPQTKLVKGYVDDMTLEFSVINNSAGNCTTIPVPFWIDRVELKPNNGSDGVSWSYYGEDIWDALSFLPTEKMTSAALLMGSDGSLAINGITLAAGASETYTVRLNKNIIDQIKLLYPMLETPFQLDIYFLPKEKYITSAANADLVMTSAALILNGVVVPEYSLNNRLAAARARPTAQFYLDPQRIVIPNATWVAGTNTWSVPKNCRGQVACIYAKARKSVLANNSSDICTYYNFDNDDLVYLDVGGNPINLQKRGKYMRLHETSQHLHTSFFNGSSVATRVYPSIFAPDIQAVFQGARTGGETFTGEEQFRIVTATANSTPHDIILSVWRYGECTTGTDGSMKTDE